LVAAPLIVLLGILALLNATSRPVFSGIALLAASVIGGPYLFTGIAHRRAVAREGIEAARRAAGPLTSYTWQEDRFFDDVERRRLAG
jgi:hypothetical protein